MDRRFQLFFIFLYLFIIQVDAKVNTITVCPSHWYAIADTAVIFKNKNLNPGLKENSIELDEITVVSSTLERAKAASVGEHIIGISDIEKIAGGNRDISRVVRAYPGVAFSPIGYRNDLIVRGGGPSENAFYMDGIEIPNINHFATQGASGGPVGLINADLIEQVQFYTGAFPAEWGGALSSVMNIRLKDGNFYGNDFKATLGASEVGFSGGGHIGKKTTWLFSARRSYLQLLFKFLGLPFLPDYLDGQLKVKHRFSPKDELTFLALAGLDDMQLNTDEKGESAEYLLSYLPQIRQKTYTAATAYRHYGDGNVLSVYLSYNYLYNSNLKYKDNNSSIDGNLILDLQSTEQKASLRVEERLDIGRWNLLLGVHGAYSHYWNTTYRKAYTGSAQIFNYETSLPIVGWGVFASGDYHSANKRFSLKAGVRLDGCNYSAGMQHFWKTFSPRLQLGYIFSESWSVNANAGVYYQLPPYTALGYKADGEYVNKDLTYMKVMETSAGVKWSRKMGNQSLIVLSLEGFYKAYGDMLLSVADGIPLACKGNDYGVVGNEALLSEGSGKAYGIELSMRWQIPGKLNFMTSATLFNSTAGHLPSAWDNKFIANAVCTWNFGRNWSAGAKLSCIGGAPYTPYDIDKSSLKEAWDVQGRPYLDYTQYNAERMGAFAQLDVRVDKSFYFTKWMLGLYVDLQNITGSKLKQQDVLMSTGVIENTDIPITGQRYLMKYIPQEAGTVVPSIGITVEF